MRKVALVTAATLAMSAAAVVVWVAARSAAEPKPPPPARESSHGAAMDDAYASVLAMYDAPEGGTPCETAHNAFAAEADKARSLGRESHFAFLADRPAFLVGCQALAPEAQRCLAPRYQARHRAGCTEALPPVGELSHLFKERPQLGDEVLAEEPPLLPEE